MGDGIIYDSLRPSRTTMHKVLMNKPLHSERFCTPNGGGCCINQDSTLLSTMQDLLSQRCPESTSAIRIGQDAQPQTATSHALKVTSHVPWFLIRPLFDRRMGGIALVSRGECDRE